MCLHETRTRPYSQRRCMGKSARSLESENSCKGHQIFMDARQVYCKRGENREWLRYQRERFFVGFTRLVYLAVLEPSRPACKRLGGDDRLPTGTRWQRVPTDWSRLIFYSPRHGSHKCALCPLRKQRNRTCMSLLSSIGKLLHSSLNGEHLSSPGSLLDLQWDLGRKRIRSGIGDCLTQ